MITDTNSKQKPHPRKDTGMSSQSPAASSGDIPMIPFAEPDPSAFDETGDPETDAAFTAAFAPISPDVPVVPSSSPSVEQGDESFDMTVGSPENSGSMNPIVSAAFTQPISNSVPAAPSTPVDKTVTMSAAVAVNGNLGESLSDIVDSASRVAERVAVRMAPSHLSMGSDSNPSFRAAPQPTREEIDAAKHAERARKRREREMARAERKVVHGTGGGKHEGASVMSALIANIAVSIVKFVAYLVSGSVAMASESVHGLADCTSELCLVAGKKLADRKPTRKHPLGFGRARYLAAFIVSVFMFSLGGMFAIVNAYSKVKSILDGGQGAHSVDNGHLLMVLVVCIIAAACEGWSLRKSIHEAKERYEMTGHPGEFELVRFWFGTKAADIVSVIAEDTIAVTGLFISAVGVIMSIATGDDIWDAFAGLLVGVLLVIGAILLGVQTASLIIGEGASHTTYDRIDRVLEEDSGIEKVLRDPIAVHISDDKLLLLLKVQIKNDASVDDSVVINRVEEKIRKSIPWYDVEIFVEPDSYNSRIAGVNEYAPSMFPDIQADF